jgi:hypothetical protein
VRRAAACGGVQPRAAARGVEWSIDMAAPRASAAPNGTGVHEEGLEARGAAGAGRPSPSPVASFCRVVCLTASLACWSLPLPQPTGLPWPSCLDGVRRHAGAASLGGADVVRASEVQGCGAAGWEAGAEARAERRGQEQQHEAAGAAPRPQVVRPRHPPPPAAPAHLSRPRPLPRLAALAGHAAEARVLHTTSRHKSSCVW